MGEKQNTGILTVFFLGMSRVHGNSCFRDGIQWKEDTDSYIYIYIYIFLYKLYILFIIVGYMHIHTDLEYFDHSLNYERIVQAFVYDIALANGISL